MISLNNRTIAFLEYLDRCKLCISYVLHTNSFYNNFKNTIIIYHVHVASFKLN